MINLRDQEVLLTGMAEAAQEAGIYLIGEQQGLGMEAVEVKGRNDFVSYVDRESERRIVRRLKALLPGAGFWAEEEARMDGDGDARWIIDPLDGTTNYIHGLPLYAVSIALENRGQVVAGLVYEPVHAEMFTAALDIPSCLNGVPIRVSGHARMEEGLLATGFPYHDFSKLEAYLGLLDFALRNSRGVRRWGSAAVDLSYVACGRFDGFFEYGLKPWDVAAGALIVGQAGGWVCDFKGKADYLYGQEIIASNPVLGQVLQHKAAEFFTTAD